MLHQAITPPYNHVIHSWEPATEVDRLALTVVPADKGKIAWQKDNDSFWILLADDPMDWFRITGITDIPPTPIAADIEITDVDSNFTATDVEGALAEIAENLGVTLQPFDGSPIAGDTVRFDGTNWIPVKSNPVITVDGSEPGSPAEKDLWLDITVPSVPVWKVQLFGDWVTISGGENPDDAWTYGDTDVNFLSNSYTEPSQSAADVDFA